MHISPPSSRRTPVPRAGLRHTQVKVKTENPKRRATVERKDVRMGRGTRDGILLAEPGPRPLFSAQDGARRMPASAEHLSVDLA